VDARRGVFAAVADLGGYTAIPLSLPDVRNQCHPIDAMDDRTKTGANARRVESRLARSFVGGANNRSS
jgi:hypothetical protein